MYHKILKICPGAYTCIKALFEGLIFGGACLWWEICISKLIGLALQLEGNLPVFALCYFAFEGNFQVQTPQGAYIWRGDLMDGFFAL